MEKQLELQMAAERDRRKKILDTQAMVNVAEGHKQRVILESEGGVFQHPFRTLVSGADVAHGFQHCSLN